MNIAQISDCHLFADQQKCGYRDINPFLSLQSILAQVSRQRPDLLLVTGDLSGDGSKQSYQHFAELLQASGIQCPYRIIPGNHDSLEKLQAHFASQYLWQNEPLRLLNQSWSLSLLNSHYQGTLGQVSEEQLRKLEDHIRLTPDVHHLVAVHHHPLDCDGWMDKHPWLNRKRFVDLVAQFNNVKAVVYGHIHMDIQQKYQDCIYLACPSTCWQWANTQNFSVADLGPGFRMIKLTESGQITTSVYRQ